MLLRQYEPYYSYAPALISLAYKTCIKHWKIVKTNEQQSIALLKVIWQGMVGGANKMTDQTQTELFEEWQLLFCRNNDAAVIVSTTMQSFLNSELRQTSLCIVVTIQPVVFYACSL